MKILIATDGSEFSQAAIETVCQVGFNAEQIRVVSAYELPLLPSAEPFLLTFEYNNLELETAVKNQVEKAVEQAEQQLRERFPDLNENLTTRIIKGSPEQVIVREAENWKADLIVIGSHGYGFWERMFLGSVSQTVVLHAPCSVLVVRKAKT